VEYYSWILAFHVMSFASWMAVLFYLPRLFIYHVEHKSNGKAFTDVIEIQERKLYSFIGVPAFWATLLSGVAMILLNLGLFESGIWLYVKLVTLVFLIAYHYSLNAIRKKLLAGSCTKTGKQLRFYNEVPTILMVIIVIMVVIKPI
jgi:putative membrane protein